MADLTVADTNTDPCCAAEQQATCCEPDEKADCCGRGNGCGCDVPPQEQWPGAPIVAAGEPTAETV